MNSTFPEQAPARAFPIALSIYFTAHIAARVLASGALELDEAEQALWTQQLAAGYGAQPPLYTWLQWLVFALTGPSVFGLALLKNILLAATYGFVWASARRWVAPSLAALAAASMLLIPQIGWESQRDLTHSVLATTMAAATLYVVVRLTSSKHRALYALLGLCAALGLLSKYSFALYLAAMALALATGRETRAVLFDRGMLLSASVALVVCLPHGLWLIEHLDEASARTLEKLAPGHAFPDAMLRGLASLAGAVAATLGAFALACIALFGRAAWAPDRTPAGARCAFFGRYLAALAALMLALVMVGGATHFKGRWLQPLLFMVPLAFFCCRPLLAGSRRLGALRVTLAVFAAIFLSLAASRPVLDGWRNRPDELNEPVIELAAALRAAGYDGKAPIVTDTPVLAGSLRLRFPEARIAVWKEGHAAPLLPSGPFLVLGRGERASDLLERAGADAGRHLNLHYVHARSGHAPVQYRYAFVR